MYRGKAGDKVSEKGGSIFTKTCCLLAILSKDAKRALVRPKCFGFSGLIESTFLACFGGVCNFFSLPYLLWL